MRPAMLILATLCTLTLSVPGSVSAATYFVSKQGSNGQSCSAAQSPSSAKQSIRDGAACLSSGDTLYIQSGTYAEAFNTHDWRDGSGSNYTRYASAPDAPTGSVILRPNGGTFVMHFTSERHHIEVSGLVIDAAGVENSAIKLDPYTSSGSPVGNNDGPSFIRFTKNTIVNGQNMGGNSGGNHIEWLCNDVHHHQWYAIYHTGRDSVIDGNLLHDNRSYGLHHYSGTGGADRNTVRNNRIYANGFSVRECFGGCTTPGMIVGSGAGSQVYNNVIYGNALHGIQVAWHGAADIGIYNNTIYGNGGACIEVGTGTGITVRNNLCTGNGQNAILNHIGGQLTQSNNLLGVDPRFVDARAGNFHLQAGSPAIDQGVRVSTVTTDMDGGARAVGGAYDIGADEFGSAGAGECVAGGGWGGPIVRLPKPTNFRLVVK